MLRGNEYIEEGRERIHETVRDATDDTTFSLIVSS